MLATAAARADVGYVDTYNDTIGAGLLEYIESGEIGHVKVGTRHSTPLGSRLSAGPLG